MIIDNVTEIFLIDDKTGEKTLIYDSRKDPKKCKNPKACGSGTISGDQIKTGEYTIRDDRAKMRYESPDQDVSHPKHYKGKSGMEVIDVIENFTEGLDGIEATDTGNIIKYACRWSKKGNQVQDVEKIIWYATHLLNHLKGKNKK